MLETDQPYLCTPIYAVRFSQRNRKGNMQGVIQLIFLFNKTEELLLVQYSVSDEVIMFIHFIQKLCLFQQKLALCIFVKHNINTRLSIHTSARTQSLLQSDLYHIQGPDLTFHQREL